MEHLKEALKLTIITCIFLLFVCLQAYLIHNNNWLAIPLFVLIVFAIAYFLVGIFK